MVNSRNAKIERVILKTLLEKSLFYETINKFYINIIKVKVFSGKIYIYIRPMKNKLISSHIIIELNKKLTDYNRILYRRNITKYALKIKFYVI